MEALISYIVHHDAFYFSVIVIVIGTVVALLIAMNNKSPEGVVESEIGRSEALEASLRRLLREGRSAGLAGSDEGGGDLEALKQEVLEKDRAIAELNKQLTQKTGGAMDAAIGEHGDSGDLLKRRIEVLEAQLEEYQLIEDDIADLSTYRSENATLKEKVKELREKAGLEPEDESVKDSDGIVVEAPLKPSSQSEPVASEESAPLETGDVADETEAETETEEPEDLVSAFEKVVQQQDALDTEGDVSAVAVEEAATADPGQIQATNEKLDGVEPDSKEEADIFISELKSLKRGS